MPLPFSRSQIDRLGDRLRASGDTADVEMLQELLLAHAEPLRIVADELSAAGLHPTTRLKTWWTIVEKLQRETTMGLKGMRDLAGARVVAGMTLVEQETALSTVLRIWPDSRVIDRRQEPMHGYRAVHVVPRVDGCFVEVQIRTGLQNAWAQFFEGLADQWGRQIRYGEPPDDPGAVAETELGTTRAEWVDYLRTNLSVGIAAREGMEHRIYLRGVLTTLEDLLERAGEPPPYDLNNPDDVELITRMGEPADDQAELDRLDAYLRAFVEIAQQAGWLAGSDR